MKSFITLALSAALIANTVAPVSAQTSTTLPLTVSPSVTKVVEATVGQTGTGETTAAQNELNQAFSKLITLYEGRLTRMQDEVNRLRIENAELRAQLTKSGITLSTPASTPVVVAPTSPAPTPAKTDLQKKHDIIMSNIVSTLPELLAKYKITATGSVGLLEFIEPKAFFISIDDGKNPIGVTAFKTKIAFEYDENFNLSLVGVFDLDYATQRYVTLRGTNPYAGTTRIRLKNPAYNGKLLEEVITVTGGNLSASTTTVTTTTPTPAPVAPTAPVVTSTGTATLAEVRLAYDKNKIGDAIRLSTSFLAVNPTNVEVLTIRARSQYISGRYDAALGDIHAIYKIQGDSIDCGIVNDGARAEKSLKGSNGTTFGTLQTTKCKK